MESQSPAQKGDYLSLNAICSMTTPPLPLWRLSVTRWAIQQKCGLAFISMPGRDQERLRRVLHFLQEAAH